jgi:glucose/arabinose dehydrogenase
VIGFGVNYGGAPIHEGTSRDGMESPKHYWVPSIATSGLLIHTGDRFPAWKGNIFVGGLAGDQIARLTMDGQREVSEETVVQGHGRIRDIRRGPDGLIYVAVDHQSGGETSILRVEPAGGS